MGSTSSSGDRNPEAETAERNKLEQMRTMTSRVFDLCIVKTFWLLPSSPSGMLSLPNGSTRSTMTKTALVDQELRCIMSFPVAFTTWRSFF